MLKKLILKKPNVQKSKHLSQTMFLKNTQSNNKKKNKLYSLYFYTSLLPFIFPNVFSMSIPFNPLSYSLFLFFLLFDTFLIPALLSPLTQELGLILSCILISLKFGC